MLSIVTDTLIDEGVAPDEFASVGGGGQFGAFTRSWSERLAPWISDDDGSVDESGERGALWERAIGWIVVALCTLMVFAIIDPHTQLWPIWDVHFGWIFRNTTTNGGDMGAHVWWPRFLSTTGSPSSGSRAGRPTGTPASRSGSTTSRSRR